MFSGGTSLWLNAMATNKTKKLASKKFIVRVCDHFERRKPIKRCLSYPSAWDRIMTTTRMMYAHDLQIVHPSCTSMSLLHMVRREHFPADDSYGFAVTTTSRLVRRTIVRMCSVEFDASGRVARSCDLLSRRFIGASSDGLSADETLLSSTRPQTDREADRRTDGLTERRGSSGAAHLRHLRQ